MNDEIEQRLELHLRALEFVSSRRAFRIRVERVHVSGLVGPETELGHTDAFVAGLDVAKEPDALQEEVISRIARAGERNLDLGISVVASNHGDKSADVWTVGIRH